MTRKRKQPRVATQPTPRKQPRSESPPSLDGTHIIWSFALFDACGAWSDGCARADEFCSTAAHMRDYERRTWAEIIANSRRDHTVPVDHLVKEARDRLVYLNQDDVDELWRLRFEGEQRIWGIKHGPLFRVLWWDPLHRVCPARKRRT